MLSARVGGSFEGFTIFKSVAFPTRLFIARMWPWPGPWHFSQPMETSEKGGSLYRPLVPAIGFVRPEWQKMQPSRMGRLNPRSNVSYPGDDPHKPVLE